MSPRRPGSCSARTRGGGGNGQETESKTGGNLSDAQQPTMQFWTVGGGNLFHTSP
ncbi:hypothetical protein BD779DRAFT_1581304, partial [Infundibulicybe gibba]